MSDASPVCPHCHEPLTFETVVEIKNQSRIKFSISPNPGELMTAKTIGGSLTNLESLLKEIGRGLKAPTEIMVEKIDTDEAGTIVFHLLIARYHDHRHSAVNREARRSEREAQREAELGR